MPKTPDASYPNQAMTVPKQIQRANRFRLQLGERRALLVIVDFLAATLAAGAAVYFWFLGQQLPDFWDFIQRDFQYWFFGLPFVWLILMIDLYDPHKATRWPETLRAVGLAASAGLGIYFVVYFTSPPSSLPRRGVAGFWIAASLLTLGWRWLYIKIFTSSRFMRRVLLVGAGSTGKALLDVVARMKSAPFYLLGLIDDDPKKQDTRVGDYKVLGSSAEMLDLIAQENISDLIVAISGKMDDGMFQCLLKAQERGLEIIRMPVAYEQLLGRVPVEHLEADWILRSFVDEARRNTFYFLFKRLLDIVGGVVGVLILIGISPFMAAWIFWDSGRPIIFSQTRAGKGGEPYTIYKFRTMRQDAEENGAPILAKEDDDRTIRFGNFLRKVRLDEWPQFINVLRGNMSLVGPRPERPELVEHFEQQIPFYRGRLLDKPGITGWAQVNFGYAETIEEMRLKLEYDLYYIKHRSLWLDVVIILRTAGTVLGFRGR